VITCLPKIINRKTDGLAQSRGAVISCATLAGELGKGCRVAAAKSGWLWLAGNQVNEFNDCDL
jgi:hypothetical protein